MRTYCLFKNVGLVALRVEGGRFQGRVEGFMGERFGRTGSMRHELSMGIRVKALKHQCYPTRV